MTASLFEIFIDVLDEWHRALLDELRRMGQNDAEHVDALERRYKERVRQFREARRLTKENE